MRWVNHISEKHGGNLAPLRPPTILYFLGGRVNRVVQDFLHPHEVYLSGTASKAWRVHKAAFTALNLSFSTTGLHLLRSKTAKSFPKMWDGTTTHI